MIFGPGDVDLPAEVWDVLAGEPLNGVLYVDIDSKVVAVATLDDQGKTFVDGDHIAFHHIAFQAIYPWPVTGKPNLFNCYYRKA